VNAFEDAVGRVASHRPIGTALQTALSHDDTLAAAHALVGFANIILARSETVTSAPVYLAAAQSGLKRAGDLTLRLSSLTLPHAIVRIVLAEQLYRALSILDNHPYHRE
jgi:hypothetical protein